MPEEIEKLEERIRVLEKIIHIFVFSDRYVFQRHLQLLDGQNIQVATGTGTKIGTTTGQKLGFFNATPVVQQASIADPTGGATVDAEARTAINSILDVLDVFGFTA